MKPIEFDYNLAMQGLGCLHKDAPLVRAAEHYFYQVSKPQIERLQLLNIDCEAAIQKLVGTLEDLKHFNNHKIEEEVWRIDAALEAWNKMRGEF
jgi:hypothetical protein